MTTLAQLVEKHDLLSADIGCRARGDGTVFYSCNVQWADKSQDMGRAVAIANGDSESEALRGALAGMVAKRTPDVELAA